MYPELASNRHISIIQDNNFAEKRKSLELTTKAYESKLSFKFRSILQVANLIYHSLLKVRKLT